MSRPTSNLADGSWLAHLRGLTPAAARREEPMPVRVIDYTIDELKTHQRGPRIVLRSKSPYLVLQEIWGHLCCHYAIHSLMNDAARPLAVVTDPHHA